MNESSLNESSLTEPSAVRSGSSCRNCGQPAGPKYCGHCGQEIESGGPLLAIAREFLADWLSLDGRLARTLALLVRPGRLTVRYLKGQRASYLRPFKLYLMASVLLFSSLLSLEAPDASEINLYLGGQLVTEAPAVQGRLNLTLFKPGSWFGHWIIGQLGDGLETMRQKPPQELLDALFAGLRRLLPSALILFVPFLALALKGLYLRSRALYVDHLVFALHVQSALFFALALTWLICRLIGSPLFVSFLAYMLVSLLILAVYVPMALRSVYRQRWAWTLLKALALLVIYGQLLKFVIGGVTLLAASRL